MELLFYIILIIYFLIRLSVGIYTIIKDRDIKIVIYHNDEEEQVNTNKRRYVYGIIENIILLIGVNIIYW